MSMRNVQAGFKCTGIYPFNRDVLIPPDEDEISSETDNLAKRTGLKFIPFYSPAVSKSRPFFTEEEEAKFEKRFEEGYDISDERYESWKKMRHPKRLQTENFHSTIDTSCDVTSSDSTGLNSNHDDATSSLKSNTSDSSHDLHSSSTVHAIRPSFSTPYHYIDPSINQSSIPDSTATSPVAYHFNYRFYPNYLYMPPYMPIPSYNPYRYGSDVGIPCRRPYEQNALPQKSSVLSKILQNGPELKVPVIPPRTCGKVLTSADHIKMIEEKEKKKEEEERLRKEKKDQGTHLPFRHCLSLLLCFST